MLTWAGGWQRRNRNQSPQRKPLSKGGGEGTTGKGGKAVRKTGAKKPQNAKGSRTGCCRSCRTVGSTPKFRRNAASTRQFTTILELRLKATSVCAKNHRRWDDPSSDGLH